MSDRTVVVVEQDRIGRLVHVETHEPGDPLPDWLEERVSGREVQAKDPRSEVKDKGAGWYDLPDGRTVRGEDAVRDAGYEVPE
jgi:hypothetical protein